MNPERRPNQPNTQEVKKLFVGFETFIIMLEVDDTLDLDRHAEDYVCQIDEDSGKAEFFPNIHTWRQGLEIYVRQVEKYLPTLNSGKEKSKLEDLLLKAKIYLAG